MGKVPKIGVRKWNDKNYFYFWWAGADPRFRLGTRAMAAMPPELDELTNRFDALRGAL
jgi:hypothetical protein